MTSEKFVDCALAYLERQGYKLIDRDDDDVFQLVMRDGNTSVFVAVTGLHDSDRFPDVEISRGEAEQAFFSRKDVFGDWVDFAVRFDKLSVWVISKDRAFLRHHTNFLALEQ